MPFWDKRLKYEVFYPYFIIRIGAKLPRLSCELVRIKRDCSGAYRRARGLKRADFLGSFETSPEN